MPTRNGHTKQKPDDRVEKSFGYPAKPVAGVDEVGRGPLAGPVVAAAVVFPATGLGPALSGKLRDSKALKPTVRSELAAEIHLSCMTAIAEATVEEIDRLNILQASLLAMSRAVTALSTPPVAALIDGNRCPTGLPCEAQAIVKGDARCLTIAAASIIAKVHRDTLMADLAADWPGYGWERNAGYPTAQHRAALLEHGITPHHRRSFAPVSQLIGVTG